MESWIRGDPLGKPTGKGRARQYCSDRCQKRAHRERETDGDVTKLAVTNTFLPFEEARSFARSLRLRSKRAWNAYCASGEKPATLPSHPEHAYKGKWKNWGDWLGTREYLPFEEARAFVRALGLKDHRAWRDYCTSGEKPAEVPACPNLVYPHVFRGWGDWLGVPSRWTKRRLLAFLADL